MKDEDIFRGPLGWRWTLIGSTNAIYENVNEEATTTKMVERHLEPNSKLLCIVCELQCTSKVALEKHVRSEHRALRSLRVKLNKLSPENNDLDSKDEPDKDRKRRSRISSESRTSRRVTQVKEGNEKKHKCTQCQKSFSSKWNMDRHRKIAHLGIRYSCTDCPKIFASNRQLQDHFRNHTGTRLVCSFCEKDFQEKRHLKRHIAKKHVNQETNENKSNDDEEDDDVMIIEDLATVSNSSPDENENKKVKKPKQPKKFRCRKCPEFFTSSEDLDEHVKNHVRITCEVCSMTFSSQDSLRIHMKSTHSFYKQNATEDVNKSVSVDETESGALDSVLQTITDLASPKKRRMRCDHCSQWFDYQWDLDGHMKEKHFGLKHHCQLCDKAFLYKENLNIHVANVHSKSTKITKETKKSAKFQCDQCEKGFKRKDSLKDHVNVAHLNIVFKCDYCEATFGYKCNLTKHMKRKHPNHVPKKITTETKVEESEINDENSAIDASNESTKSEINDTKNEIIDTTEDQNEESIDASEDQNDEVEIKDAPQDPNEIEVITIDDEETIQSETVAKVDDDIDPEETNAKSDDFKDSIMDYEDHEATTTVKSGPNQAAKRHTCSKSNKCSNVEKMDKKSGSKSKVSKKRKSSTTKKHDPSDIKIDKVVNHDDNEEMHSSPSPSKIRKLQSKNGRRFQCQKCPKSFLRSGDLESHQAAHAGGLKCDYCLKVFDHTGKFKSHVKIHKKNGDTTSTEVFLEDLKDFDFDQESIPVQEPKPLWECEMCLAPFEANVPLRKHIQEVHLSYPGSKKIPTKNEVCKSKIKNFKHCEFCDDYVSKGILKHYREKHGVTVEKDRKDRDEICLFCLDEKEELFVYYFNEGLRRHDIKVHQNSQGKFPCKFCDLIYESQRGHDCHFNTFHKEDELLSKN